MGVLGTCNVRFSYSIIQNVKKNLFYGCSCDFQCEEFLSTIQKKSLLISIVLYRCPYDFQCGLFITQCKKMSLLIELYGCSYDAMWNLPKP